MKPCNFKKYLYTFRYEGKDFCFCPEHGEEPIREEGKTEGIKHGQELEQRIFCCGCLFEQVEEGLWGKKVNKHGKETN